MNQPTLLATTLTNPVFDKTPSLADGPRLQQARASLERWLGTSLTIVETNSGRVFEARHAQPNIEWRERSLTLAEAARRGTPCLIEDEDPVVVLAAPLIANDHESWIAVGCFLTRPVTPADNLHRAAEALGCSSTALSDWSAQAKVIAVSELETIAELAVSKLQADARIVALQAESDELAQRIGATYEEISLIYRLTQNLKLSGNRETLAQLALHWLADVVPAGAIVIQFAADPEQLGGPEATGNASRLIVGEARPSTETLDALFADCAATNHHQPAVINRGVTGDASWQFPEIRECVIVPIAEGSRNFGWLAIFNHPQDREYGTSEASLLSSIGTILGVHTANVDLYRQQADMLADVVRAMSSAIDAKDPYTRGHSDRVARVAVEIARGLGCDAETIKTIYLSGLLHDIGKIGINDDVLRKPGRLTEPEFEHVRTHVTIGYKILKDLRKMQHMLPVVLHHHESWDGNGYPHNLKAEEIPYLARIVAVADAFDAMTSDRPYRRGMAIDKVNAILKKGAGQQWDPKIIEAYFRCEGEISKIVNRSVDDSDLAQLQWN